MATPEHIQETAKSSIKIATTAKGDATVEVKLYDGADALEIERIRALAVQTYNNTARDVRVQTGGAA